MAESSKVEARLNELLATALRLYMRDNHLENESELLRSVLGQFLEGKGYLVRTSDPGEYKVVTPLEKPVMIPIKKAAGYPSSRPKGRVRRGKTSQGDRKRNEG